MKYFFKFSMRKITENSLIFSLTWLAAAGWTLLVGGAFVWTLQNDEQKIMDMAYAEARASLNKDISFRRWATDHGGVYVPETEKQRPIPALEHVPERNITTPSGRQLTLLNPATMVRQQMDRYSQAYGVRGRITGLKYLNPANAPDDWERTQLEAFARKDKEEVWDINSIDGQPYLRYLRVMFMEPGCEKCHAIMGYKTGDVRGATGLNLPLASYYQKISIAHREHSLILGTIWILGLAGIWLFSVLIRRREGELQQSKAIIDSTDDAVISKTLDGIITSWNAGAEKIFGYTAKEAIGKPISFLISAVHQNDESGMLERLSRGEKIDHHETTYRCKDDRLIDVSTTISPIRNKSGKIIGTSKIVRDISENRKVKRELEDQKAHLEELVDKRTIELSDALVAAKLADQTKDAFLANISHELRTPLNAVIGMANLARNISTESKQQDYLEKIVTSGKHLNRIVNDLLDLSKIAAGRMEFEHIPFRVRELIKHCNSVMALRMEEKGLQFVETVDDAVPEILVGDPARIEQVLLNLFGNAIKFTPSGRIGLRVSLHNRMENQACLEIEVEDSGIGMRQEDIEHVFETFSQADASISRKYGGTGLGLPISRSLTRSMGGDITVTSRVGFGTTFKVTIWLDIGDPSSLPVAEACAREAPQACYENVHILVVEDQSLNREIVEALLSAIGITPRMATNGQEAIDILGQSTPDTFDLVLMDIQMPVMDGLNATRIIRGWSEFTSLPIVGMTAHTMEHEKKIGAEAGMNDHIGKPFDNAGFYRTLAKWLPNDKQKIAGSPETEKNTTKGTPATSPSVFDLATLHGIDIREALARFNGKEDRYRHWLADFMETAGKMTDTIRQAIGTGDSEIASKTAHTLKGRVGMLGMKDLHTDVSELEQLLRTGMAADDLLGKVERAVAQMCEQLASALGLSKPSTAASERSLDHVLWNDAYSVGVVEMDDQHKRLIGMINRLADCKRTDSACQFHEILTEMFDYTQIHFQAEEVYLEKIGYPELAAHEREHAAFIEKVATVSMAATDGIRDMVGVYDFLKSWLLGHILKSDMDYRHFVEQKNR